MDAQQAFDRFERSGAGWLPLVLMILAATLLTGATLAGVGSVPTEEPQLLESQLEESRPRQSESGEPQPAEPLSKDSPADAGEFTEERISDE